MPSWPRRMAFSFCSRIHITWVSVNWLSLSMCPDNLSMTLVEKVHCGIIIMAVRGNHCLLPLPKMRMMSGCSIDIKHFLSLCSHCKTTPPYADKTENTDNNQTLVYENDFSGFLLSDMDSLAFAFILFSRKYCPCMYVFPGMFMP